MSELYDVLRERLKMRPMVALRWIYGPKDLPAARIPSYFMDERRRLLQAKRLAEATGMSAIDATEGASRLRETWRRLVAFTTT